MKGAKAYEHLFDRRWYIQSFNATPALIHFAGKSCLRAMKESLGYSYTHFIKDFREDVCEMYYDRDDLHALAHEFESRYHKDKDYLNKLIQKSERGRDNLLGFIHNVRGRIGDMPDEELVDSYKKLALLNVELIAENHMIEGYALTRDIRLKNHLIRELERKGKGREFNRCFEMLTAPVRMAFITEYNNTIIRLLDAIRKSKSLHGMLRERRYDDVIGEADDETRGILRILKDKFFWIRSSYKESPEAGDIDFLEEALHIDGEKSSQKETKDAVFANNLMVKEKLIEDLELPEEIIEIIRVTDTMTWWQDDRKRHILHCCCVMDSMLSEMSGRFNVPQRHLRYLLPEEVSIDKIKELPESFYRERISGLLVIYEGGTELLTGSDYGAFRSSLKSHEDGEEIREITGISAGPGNAVGRVRLCQTPEDISSFVNGDVLVTSMTRPEFVPAMKKAAAIVTDEGGITCHAAVISRELGKPCIIGTKIATKRLRDNDLVEVDANHGVIKIMNEEEDE